MLTYHVLLPTLHSVLSSFKRLRGWSCASPLLPEFVRCRCPLPFEKFKLRHVGIGKVSREVFVRWIPQQPSSLLVFEKGPRGEVNVATREVRTGTHPSAVLRPEMGFGHRVLVLR